MCLMKGGLLSSGPGPWCEPTAGKLALPGVWLPPFTRAALLTPGAARSRQRLLGRVYVRGYKARRGTSSLGTCLQFANVTLYIEKGRGISNSF